MILINATTYIFTISNILISIFHVENIKNRNIILLII